MLLLFVICLIRNSSASLSNLPFIRSLGLPSLSHWDFYSLLLSTNFFRSGRHPPSFPISSFNSTSYAPFPLSKINFLNNHSVFFFTNSLSFTILPLLSHQRNTRRIQILLDIGCEIFSYSVNIQKFPFSLLKYLG